MKAPHISLALVGKRLVAHGYGEFLEADWGNEGLVERGRLCLPRKAAEALKRTYRTLFHRGVLVWPRVRAFLPVGAPPAEYLLWDGVLRASGAWDWEMTGVESTLVRQGYEGYTAIAHSARDFVGAALLKGRERAAASLVQTVANQETAAERSGAAARLLSELLASYAACTNPDEAGLLAAVEVRAFCLPASSAPSASSPGEVEEAFREELGNMETGGTLLSGENELEVAAREALSVHSG